MKYKKEASNALSIEELDCFIEEYKNIPRKNISMGNAVAISLCSVFIATLSTMLSLEDNFFGRLINLGVNISSGDLYKDKDKLYLFLTLLLFAILCYSTYCWLYNFFNQKRLSFFYQRKRELIREKNDCTDKSTDL